MNTHAFLAGLRLSPDYLLQHLDPVNRRGLVVKLTEADYRRTAFLDERAFTKDTQGAWFPVDAILAETEGLNAPAPHFIFQVGHCGSTLVSKLLGELPGCFPVREPVALLMLALEKRELERPVARFSQIAWEQLLTRTSLLLSRVYRSGDRAVIKATSACGNLAETLLRHHPQSRALCLYTDLETWLASMLKNEANRENGRAFAQAWLMDLHSLTGHRNLQLSTLSDAEQYAVNWLACMLYFQRAEQSAGERLLRLDFEDWLRDSPGKTAEVARFLGFDAAQATALTQGPLMKSYAKNPNRPYDADTRRQEMVETRQRCGAEIRAGMSLAERLCGEITMLAPLAGWLRPAD